MLITIEIGQPIEYKYEAKQQNYLDCFDFGNQELSEVKGLCIYSLPPRGLSTSMPPVCFLCGTRQNSAAQVFMQKW